MKFIMPPLPCGMICRHFSESPSYFHLPNRKFAAVVLDGHMVNWTELNIFQLFSHWVSQLVIGSISQSLCKTVSCCFRQLVIGSVWWTSKYVVKYLNLWLGRKKETLVLPKFICTASTCQCYRLCYRLFTQIKKLIENIFIAHMLSLGDCRFCIFVIFIKLP